MNWPAMTHPAPGGNVAQQAPERALQLLGSQAPGLAAAEAARRLREFGANRVQAARKDPAWLLLLREFGHFFALILWLAAGLAFLSEHFQPGQGMARLGAAVVGVIVVNGCFSFWQAYRAEQALAALCRLLPQQVAVRRGGRVEAVAAEGLVPGDVVLLAEGARVPADCRILEAWGLRVNMATLTGESMPQARGAEPDLAARDPLAARSLLLAGTLIVAGECSALVYATGMQTEFGRIARLTQTVADTESPLQLEIRRVSRLVALLALGLGVLFFLVGRAVGLPFWANFMFAIGIIVANVPEGLLPTVTLSLALATQRMARRNALVRHLQAVETLGSASVILTDKTGTLTENRMAVREFFAAGGHRLAMKRWPRGRDLHLRAVAGLCHSLRFPGGEPAGDPMEAALWQFAGRLPDLGRKVAEIPFDAERRRMSVLTRTGDGSGFLWCKGAPEAVLPLCRRWDAGEAPQPLDAEALAMFRRAHENMAERGLRVLALAWKPLAPDDGMAGPGLEQDLELCGLVGLDDPPRADVREAVTRCHGAGLRVIVVTGDHPHTALALARQVDIVRGADPVVLTGERMRDLSPAALQLALDAPEILFARVSAAQKLQVVQALQQKGEIVAVTGDGVNDAPALRQADIGIAMGRGGTDVARESADIVLLDDHFATIVNAVEEGRAVFENIRKFMTYILTSNIPEIVPYLAFALLRIPLPLTVIQILAVDLGTDMLPALALGAERPNPAVMARPPRPRGERLLTWGLIGRAYLFLGLFEAAAALSAFFLVLHGAGWTYGQALQPLDPVYLQATTACLGAIVLMQMANLFLCRESVEPVWARRLGENPLIVPGLAAELGFLLAIVFTPAGQWLFGTLPPPETAWLAVAPFALAMALLEEARKAWLRRLRADAGRPGPRPPDAAPQG